MSSGSYRPCRLCPRDCGVDRGAGKRGFCGESSAMRIAYAGLHAGEEPVISGRRGSGTVFFTGCTLRCRFCQNWQISQREMGREASAEELAAIFLSLEREGAANLNLVTGTHFLPHVLEADRLARQQGVDLPLVWNSSGYETLASMELMREQVRVYLLDIKTLDTTLARSLYRSADYPERAREAILYASETTRLRYRDDLLLEGLVVRHLVLPGLLDASREVLEWFARSVAHNALLSLMFQYEPVWPPPDSGLTALDSGLGPPPDSGLTALRPGLTPSGAGRDQGLDGDPGVPTRRVSLAEYELVSSWLEELHIVEGFIQEPPDPGAAAGGGGQGEAADSWLPDFARPNPFSSELSRPVWSWIGGR